jgi:hypothetical protein
MKMEASSTKPSDIKLETLKLERDIQNEILLEFGAKPWLRIWRQNTGKAYGYSTINGARALLRGNNPRAALQMLDHAQLVTYGQPGAADIQGILSMNRLGFSDGRFLAIEVKRVGGKQTDEQLAWQAMVQGKGGIYILAHSLLEVRMDLRSLGYPA